MPEAAEENIRVLIVDDIAETREISASCFSSNPTSMSSAPPGLGKRPCSWGPIPSRTSS